MVGRTKARIVPKAQIKLLRVPSISKPTRSRSNVRMSHQVVGMPAMPRMMKGCDGQKGENTMVVGWIYKGGDVLAQSMVVAS